MLNVKKIEDFVHEKWKKDKVPETIVKMDLEKRKKFYLLDGPPYINGIPHVGHIKTTTFKDIWGKFKYMQGFSVWFQPGFDCGGLPIENKVEKKLDIRSKKDIEEKVGVDKFIEHCKEFAKGNESIWLELYKKIGAWRGWLSPYLTSENYYIESGWWTVKQMYEKGMFVHGHRPGFWCPHCETVLSGYEVTDSYKDVEDPSIFLKFPLKTRRNEYLLVWTTTPWTLPANVAIAVHPDEIYVKVKVGEEHFILAKKRLELLTKLNLGYVIEEEFSGHTLSGLKYEPVIDVPLQRKIDKMENCHKVILSIPLMKKRVASKMKIKTGTKEEDEFGHIVDVESGTGLVHIAPGHGDVDNKLGKHYKLPEVSPVDEKGRLTADAGKFSGMFVKDADSKIIEEINKNGKMLHNEKIVHSYPLCWRCKTPLIYRMSKQWFLSIDMIRDKMMKENDNRIRWLPDFARERMRNVITDAPDWAITRQRYWGIPTPVWVCDSCGAVKVIGSREELKKYAIEDVPEDLHKNSVDKIHLKCDCGSKMTRIPDIMDVWFDSGIAPWASLGYPYKNKELFEQLKPVDLIDESQDQVRGWFYSLLFCGVAVFEKSSYKTVCLNGWTLDAKGNKMSKSIGNVILAEDAYKELGADALRLYCCHDTAPWETQKFSMKNAKELMKKLDILFNIYNYFRTYCKVSRSVAELKTEDKWIISRLNNLIQDVTINLENFRFHEASRSIMNFIIEDFSRTYIKLIRERKDDAVDYTMTYVLEHLLRIFSPFIPFISDYIYYNIFNESVHLKKWPEADKYLIDKKIEDEMSKTDNIISSINSMRQEKNVKLRWTIKDVSLKSEISKEMEEIIKKLANVNKIIINKKQEEDIISNFEFDEKNALLNDLMRSIQQKRKEHGLVVSDRITLHIEPEYLKKYESEIKKRVGAETIIFEKIENPMNTVKINKLSASFKFVKTK